MSPKRNEEKKEDDEIQKKVKKIKKKCKAKKCKRPVRSPPQMPDENEQIININSKKTEFHDVASGNRNKAKEMATQHSHPDMPKIDQSQSAMSKANTSEARNQRIARKDTHI